MRAFRRVLGSLAIRNLFRRNAMPPPTTTQVLSCDPASISFPERHSEPQISSKETLEALHTAVHELLSSQMPVVFPTETVYGLAAPALSASAVAKIFSVKGRPPDNPLIVHVCSIAMLSSILPPSFTMPPSYPPLIQAFWPGPLTLLFPASSKIPPIVTASRSTVAVRMPSHPISRSLIALADVPLAAPSANTSGKPSPTKAEHVSLDLFGKVRIILDGGPCQVGVESTVVDGLGEDGILRVLRPGGVTVEDITRVLQDSMVTATPQVLVHRRDYEDAVVENAPTTPGMKYRHYSPSVPVILLMTGEAPPATRPLRLKEFFATALSSHKAALPFKLGLMTPSDSPLALVPTRIHKHAGTELDWHFFPLGRIAEPALTAQRLFDGLLTLEKEGVDLILVEGISDTQEGLAVMNRINKAAREVYWLNVDGSDPSSDCGFP